MVGVGAKTFWVEQIFLGWGWCKEGHKWLALGGSGGCLEALDGPGAFDSCMITREMLGAGELGGPP